MGIGAEARAADLLPVALKLFRAQPPFEESPRVNAGRGMGLEEHEIAARAGVGAKEMVEAHLEDFRRRGVAGDVAAQFAIGLIGARDHGERVPTQDRGEAVLDSEVAGVGRLTLGRNRVAIRRERQMLGVDAQLPRARLQRGQNELHALPSRRAHEAVERAEPVGGLLGVGISGVYLDRRRRHGSLRGKPNPARAVGGAELGLPPPP